jgi:cytochrome P450
VTLARRLGRAWASLGQWANYALGVILERDAVGAISYLRRHRPILPTPKFTMVLRDPDVREVIASRDSFTVDLYGVKIEKMAGLFALGTDDRVKYPAARRILGHAFRDGDVERIRDETATLAAERIAAAMAVGRVDVVTDVADPVLAHVVLRHLGTPAPDATTFLAWTRSVFEEIFLNAPNVDSVRRRAERAAAAMGGELDRAIGRGPTGSDDVLNRLLAARDGGDALDDAAIRGNLIGLAAAWIPNSSKCFALAMAELLERPDALAEAQAAARADDDERVAACLFEALRFRPLNAALLRLCVRDHEVAAGTPRARTIKAGTPVLAMTKSAMMDEDAIEAPEAFRTDRPVGDYLHFGYGRHSCLGEPVSRVQLPAMAKPILRLDGLRLAGRPALRWGRSYPTSLRVAFQPRGAEWTGGG